VGTCCRCCFVSTGETYFAEVVAMANVAVAKALALRAHVPAGKGVILLATALPELFFHV
jgi:hypothetical protein